MQRKFIVHIPPNPGNGGPAPLVVFLHGGSGNAQSAQGFTLLNLVSNFFGFLAVYPEGYAPVEPSGFSWADGRGTSADDAGIDDVGFINSLIDTLLTDYAIDSARVYLSGFSNGGFMTQRIACEANQQFAAMASLGSTMDTMLFANCHPGRPVPMLLVMGTADPFVPYAGGPMQGDVTPVVSMDTLVQFWTANNDCQSTLPAEAIPDTDTTDHSTVTRFDNTDCTCNADVRLFRINNGGHTWPGVENASYELLAGETNEDMQAGVELWQFFSEHTRCDPAVSTAEENEPELPVTVFPNPTTGRVTIAGQQEVRHATITDFSGRVVIHRVVNAFNPAFSLMDLPPGLYLLTLQMRGGNRTVHKILKR